MSNKVNRPWQQNFLKLIAAAGLLMSVSCATVPITGRSQLNLIPSDDLLTMSFQQYDEILQESQLSQNAGQRDMVERVGTRIQAAVEEYFADDPVLSAELATYAWEFNLVESEEVNAFCMPGGKVVVYTGLLPVAQDETGLAVVMGHEVAHAIARHGNERMSQMLAMELGGVILAEAVSEKPAETQLMWFLAYGVASHVGAILPYSRLHESEADHLGIIFMAMAGYDPREAPAFWSRMAGMGSEGWEIFSTHPSSQTRVDDITAKLPEVMPYYRPVE